MRQPSPFLVLLLVVLVAGCGGDEPGTTTVTVTSPTTTAAEAEPYDGEDGEIAVTSPATEDPVETAEDSFVVEGKSVLDEVMVTNVGGPNDIEHPDAGEMGYPEYVVKVGADGSWEQRVAIFPGENSIFVEDSEETISVERVITGTGTATPGSFKDGAEPAEEEKAEDPQTVDEAQQELYDASAALGLTKAATKVAQYCVRTVGARIGAEEPPGRALVRAKDDYVQLVRRMVKNYPDIEVTGEPLRDYLRSQVRGFRRSDCDAELAADVEAAMLTLEP